MNIKLFYFFIFILFSNTFIYSQDFKRIDSIVLSYPKSFNNYIEFAEIISTDFSSDIERVRGIYTWMAYNINYDIEEYGKFAFSYSSEQEREIKRKIYYSNLANRVISKNIAVCEGYAILFFQTCNFLNIKTTFVDGISKLHYKEIGKTFNKSRHGWNIVEIDNKKYFVDVTYASVGLKSNKSHFEFNFLAAPEIFIKNHYPNNYENSLLDNFISKDYFINSPLYEITNYTGKIMLVTQQSSLLKISKYPKQKFIFESSESIYSIVYSFGGRGYEIKDFKKKGNQFEFEIDFTNKEKGREYLTIFFNLKPIVTYKIK